MLEKHFLQNKKGIKVLWVTPYLPKIDKNKFFRQSWTKNNRLFAKLRHFVTPQAFEKHNQRPFNYLYGLPLLFSM